MHASRLDCLSACLGIGIALVATAVSAQTETILHDFSQQGDATGRFLQLKSGSLLGTTYNGGGASDGTVYQLNDSNGIWKYNRIWSLSGPDGIGPYDGVTQDGTNSYFGTAQGGGANGLGTIFKLSLTDSGWQHSVVYNFDGHDSAYPQAVLIADTATNTLYGTTYSSNGGAGCGSAFSFTTGGTFSTLYVFQGGTDGCHPRTGLTFGAKSGILYGTTLGGGAYSQGTVFELKEQSGVWSEHVIHSFRGGSNGAQPSDFRVDANGNLFGVAGGGRYNQGIVFELAKSGTHWDETTIYAFKGGTDGATPVGLHLDLTTGAIYGTTYYGGTYNEGTAFVLSQSGGAWSETILHGFGGAGDGAYPVSRPIQDKTTGNLYGTTYSGGNHDAGVVYMIAP